ncbi:EAL domain-containing protein [Chromobacterium phragmitis]|uniref:EAL domain-containing protein n=1 Tax=Chromobacterium phragmitis TaxID=2202141 RepID=UPI00143CFF8A|nr:EAL domain-containing protein [Chromobacterium phragmitis]
MIPSELVRSTPTRDTLDAALRNNEFRLHYQPQLSCSSLQLTGAEALTRWKQSPSSSKLTNPSHFIPQAEENGFIMALGDWCLQTAIQTTSAWERGSLPPHFRTAINLSVRQITPELPKRIDSLIREAGLDPWRIELEITESFLFQDLPTMTDIARQLRNLGVRVAIDDFGTGFSVLEHLRHIPATTIKIDRSFTQRMLRIERDHIIMRNLIRMIRDLGMESICEGVETAEQLKAVQDMGADHWQGFLFSPAIPAENLTLLLPSESDTPPPPEQPGQITTPETFQNADRRHSPGPERAQTWELQLKQNMQKRKLSKYTNVYAFKI